MSRHPAPRLKAPSAGALLLHAGITALALAIGLGRCAPAAKEPEAPLAAGPADLEPAREDLAATRRTLDAVARDLAAPGRDGGSSPAAPSSVLAGLVPPADAPAGEQERFARRLVQMETRSRARRTRAYYDMVTRPLLPGFDDATIERVCVALADYVTGTKAIPWGVVGGQRGGAAESWRQVLEDQDRILREKLQRELPPEKVELLRGRFAMPVPAAGEALPTPRLGGTGG